MRRAVFAAAAAILLACPTVLAFYSGGFYAEPRLIAAIVVWALVLAVTLAGPAPLPRSRAGWLALGGLALLVVWSALSLAWAPLGGPAVDSVQRLVLYLGALVLTIGVLKTRGAMRAIEPSLAAGTVIVIGYGLAGRLLPGLLELDRSRSAGGRLEQPITYWNAEGALAAVGLILCARLAGDRTRPAALRIAAAAAAPALGAGVYLSYSRGAIAVTLLGLAILVAAAPSRSQLRASLLALASASVAAAAASAFPGVAALEGSEEVRDGAAVLTLLLAIAAFAALVSARLIVVERQAADREDVLPWARRLAPAVTVVAAAVAAGLVVAGLAEKPGDAEPAAGAQATRLTTVSSNRYEYWRVGLEAMRQQPLRGLGAGGFRVFWLRQRSIPEAVRDIHSLELEIAVELGLVGLLAFALVLAGVAAATRRALRRDSVLAAGWVAALAAWLLHASIDWDWQLPAVALPALVLAGALVALSEAPAAAVSER